jgi:signal transduction histidine kinase
MARLLVADDDAADRQLMRACLLADGHEIVEATTGEGALARAAATPVDLALVDIIMPGLNGFETTVRLKQLAGDEFLPVVLVSSLPDPSSRVLGLRMGADDFLAKPIDRSELRARVNNLLSLRSKEHELHQRHRELLELQRFRDEMSALLVHDLKNPISVVLTNLEHVLASSRLEPDVREPLADARLGAQRTLRLLANLLDVARSDAGRLVAQRTPQRLHALVAPLVERYRRVTEPRQVTVELTIAETLELPLDGDLLTRVIENILDNSLRYTPVGGRIRIDAARVDGRVRLQVGNSGPPIPVAARERIFDKFARADPGLRGSNIGLGLYFCRLAVEAHGGAIHVEEQAGLPTVFVIDLGA